MRSKQLALGILAIFTVLIILISGCTPNVEKPVESSTCPSPYDGTYSGMVSGSGEQTRWVDDETITTPYIISYNLEVTFKCDGLEQCGDTGIKTNQQCWILIPTHAKASDPYCGCINGCDLEETIYTLLPKPGERGGVLQIQFPNKSYIMLFHVSIDPDAKRISADQLDPQEMIENTILGHIYQDETGRDIEQATFRYPPTECVYDQQGVTMTLDKIS